MYSGHYLKRHSVYFSLLISYILMLITPIIFSIIVYYISCKTIEDEITRSNLYALGQIQLSIDNTLQDVEKMAVDISMNKTVDSVLKLRGPISPVDQYTIMQVEQEFIRYKTVNGSIKNFYVYFNNIDSIIMPGGAGSTKLMYDIIHNNTDFSFSKWNTMMSGYNFNRYIPMNFEGIDEPRNKTIAYVQSIPLAELKDPLGTIVVLLDEGRIEEMMRNKFGVDREEILVLNQDNEILVGSNKYNDKKLLNNDILANNTGTIKNVHIAKDEVAVSYIVSPSTKLKYVSITPQSTYMAKSKNIKALMIFSSILCIFIGGISAFVLTKRNYLPINNLVTTLAGERKQLKLQRKYNEYSYIQDILSKILTEQELASNKIAQQTPLVQKDFIINLLKGRISYKVSRQDMLSSFDIEFKSDYFAVLLIGIEDYGDIFFTGSVEDTKDNIKIAQLAVRNVFEELIRKNDHGYLVDLDDMVAGIINLGTGHVEKAENELLLMAREAKEFIKDKLHISLTVSISNVHKMLNGISEAYEEAMDAMEYRFVKGRNEIIHYSNIDIAEQKYNYALGTEERLINSIKTGNYGTAEDILEGVFEDNFGNGSPSLQIAKCLMYDLIGTVIKTLEETGVAYESMNPVVSLMQCKTVIEMKELMAEILMQVCRQIQDEKKKNTPNLSDKVKEYVGSNYADVNLGVPVIAEHFEITPNYLSRLFKEQTDEGLLEYINRMRMEKAKMLLKEGEHSLADIAMKVGYSNSNTLIRIFKKYEGLTPGQYKGNAN